MKHNLSAADVLQRYMAEELSDFLGIKLIDVNQLSHDGDTPLHISCIRGLPEEVVALLEGGANIDAFGEFQYSPLHHAVEHDHIEIVRILLARGANTKSRNDDGLTALEIAQENSYSDIVKLLESHAVGHQ